MVDPRIKKLADVLVRYSVALKKNDVVIIRSELVAEPLVVELYRAAIEAGAHPHIKMAPAQITEIMLKHGSDEQLRYVSPLTLHEIETIDARIGIWSEVNTKALTNTDAAKHALLSAANKPVISRVFERSAQGKLRWTGTLFPTNSSAQDAQMSLAEYEDFVFGAGFLEKDDPVEIWKQIEQRQDKVVRLLNGKKTLRLENANGTDLTMSIEARKWINCCGKKNFPDGEVFTCPVEESVNGSIVFSFPAVHMGHECDGVKLRFENGKVVEATAQKDQDFLIKMIEQDEGARMVGEFSFGCNYNIQRFTSNTLFDEKIGGTVHLALGAAIPEAGGKNQSGLHWDMVCDLRQGGRVTVDGQTVHENGRFTTIEI